MKMGNLFASTAVAALLSLGLSAVPVTLAHADVEATTAVGQPEELIGKNVKDEQGNTVGEIDSVLIDKDGKVRYVVVGVGGFLGIGEQNVALQWDQLRMNEDGSEILAPGLTKDSVSQLPPHRYGNETAQRGKVYSLDDDIAANPYLGDDNAAGAAAENNVAANDAAVTAPPGAVDSQALIGKDIVNPDGNKVGEVDSVIIDQGGEVKYVVAAVGGFMGMGEKQVAMRWEDLKVDAAGDRVSANVTKEQLEALPEYKRPENMQAGTVYSYDDAVRSNQYLAEGGVAQTQVAEGDAATDLNTQAGTEATTDIDNETTVTAAGLRASDVVGADVKNPAGDNIGEISEVILQQDGSVNGVVVDVGGFLGVGDRPVLLEWKDLQFTGIEGDLAVTTALNKDQLQTFPEYRSTK